MDTSPKIFEMAEKQQKQTNHFESQKSNEDVSQRLPI